MSRKPSIRPNDVELQILRVLWDGGPQSVRQVHQALRRTRPTVYTSTAKMMQVMCCKGLLKDQGFGRPQLYRPAVPQERTQRHILRELIAKVFGGSTRTLVMHAVEAEPLSPAEVREIRQLLAQMEKQK